MYLNKYEDKVKSNPSRTYPRICCFGARVFVSSLNKLYGESSGATHPNLFLALSKFIGSENAAKDFRFGSILITISILLLVSDPPKIVVYKAKNLCPIMT